MKRREWLKSLLCAPLLALIPQNKPDLSVLSRIPGPRWTGFVDNVRQTPVAEWYWVDGMDVPVPDYELGTITVTTGRTTGRLSL